MDAHLMVVKMEARNIIIAKGPENSKQTLEGFVKHSHIFICPHNKLLSGQIYKDSPNISWQ